MFLLNVGKLIPDFTTSVPGRQWEYASSIFEGIREQVVVERKKVT
jgi:hypothetical protein